MEYTQAEVMAKMAQFIDSARRVKELKDYLLGFNFYSNDPEFLEEQIKQHDDAIAEVGRIYDEEMQPLIEEMAAYLNCHREDFESLLEAERELNAMDEAQPLETEGAEQQFEADEEAQLADCDAPEELLPDEPWEYDDSDASDDNGEFSDLAENDGGEFNG